MAYTSVVVTIGVDGQQRAYIQKALDKADVTYKRI